MRSNENMSWMRNHIFNIAESSNSSQRKLQEVRNQRLFGTEPVYTVADLMEDMSMLNQEQYNWFVTEMGVYNRQRLESIYEQYDAMISDVIYYKNSGMKLFESASESYIDLLVEAQADRIQMRIRELERRLGMVPKADKAAADAITKQIQQARNQLDALNKAGAAGSAFADAKKKITGTNVKTRKPTFGSPEDKKLYSDASRKLKTARTQVAKAKKASDAEGPLPDSVRDVREPAPQTTWEKWKADQKKHTGIMLKPAGEGLKYYMKRALEIGKNVGKGVAGFAGDVGKLGVKATGKAVGAGVEAAKKVGTAGVEAAKKVGTAGAEATKKAYGAARTGAANVAGAGIATAKMGGGAASRLGSKLRSYVQNLNKKLD